MAGILYAGRGLKSRFLCVNLLDGGVCRGRINLRENPEIPFCPWHGFFLERVRDALLPMYLRRSRKQEHFRRRREFVQLLLEGEKNVQDELYWFLEDIGWKEQGRYVCGCIRMEQMEERSDAAAYYARELAYLAEDTVCIPVEQRIYSPISAKPPLPGARLRSLWIMAQGSLPNSGNISLTM